jgi:hypothetical protein
VPVACNYVEAPLNFRPTYKLDIGTDMYDTGSKKRIPAWTDRILYVPNGLNCLAYNADFSLQTSDHRPVYASFAVKIDCDVSSSSAQEAKTPSFSSESQVCAIM